MNLREKVASVKAKVTCMQVLNDFGNYHIQGGANQQISCFAHDDLKPSARYYSKTDSVYCFTCTKSYDAIAAFMVIRELDFAAAVDSLVVYYKVPVEAQPERIQKFYQQAAEITKGDPKRIKEQMVWYGQQFKKFYEEISGISAFSNVLDYLWEEYDKLFIMDDKPSVILKAASEWYILACSLMASYRDVAADIVKVKEAKSLECLQD